jgi:thiosulfate/3-mercaptopyruvate sulfurtransferase
LRFVSEAGGHDDASMSTENGPLIQPEALQALLARADVDTLVVDCRADIADPAWGARAWAEGHIPGAVHAHMERDLSGAVTPQSGRHPLPDPADFAATLGRWGVTPLTRVVAYDQGPGFSAARLRWMLRSIGHGHAQVLDGGFAAWRAAGLPVTTAEPAARPATAVPVRAFTDWLTTAQLRDALGTQRVLLVDARPADRFAGRNEVIDPVAGHVPGAVSRPCGANVDANGRFLPAATLRAHWLQVLGARQPTEAAMMCGSGVTACHNLLALEIAGLPGAALYAGSWSEWIRDPARPVSDAGAGQLISSAP